MRQLGVEIEIILSFQQLFGGVACQLHPGEFGQLLAILHNGGPLLSLFVADWRHCWVLIVLCASNIKWLLAVDLAASEGYIVDIHQPLELQFLHLRREIDHDNFTVFTIVRSIKFKSQLLSHARKM